MNSPASAAARAPLRRAADDRVVLGLCAGIARTLELRPLLVRIGVVLLGAIAFPLVAIAYTAIALIVPRDDGRALLGGAPADRREQLLGWSALLLICFLVVGAGVQPTGLVWPALSDGGLLLAALGVGVLAVHESRRAAAPVVPGAPAPGTPPAPAAAPPAPAAPTMQTAATPPAPTSTAASAVLPSGRRAAPIQDGTLVMPAARTGSGGRGWLIAAGMALLLIAAIVAAGVVAAAAIGGVGSRTERPATIDDLRAEYRLGVGDLDIDLTGVALPRGTTDLRARVGAGAVTVIVPRGVRVESTGATELTGVTRVNRIARAERLRAARAAVGPRRPATRATTPVPAPRTVRIDADVSLGSASVIAVGG